MKNRIAISAGDINGIGPEIIRKSLASGEFTDVHFAVFGPESALRDALAGVKAKIFDCGPAGIMVNYGTISPEAGEAALRAVKSAVEATLAGEYHALVTAPISKEAVRLAGYDYAGHTEMLQEWCGAGEVIMMFLSETLIVGLMTTHLALREVPDALSIDYCIGKIRLFDRELSARLKIAHPHIALCALNPHAGENGMMGREEIEVLTPCAAKARSQGIDITDPLPADTLFPRAKDYSGVMAMYHDQGLIPAKTTPGGSVNYTGGLPIIRTSPDHGTAFDIAGKDSADPRGMINAIKWALRLAE